MYVSKLVRALQGDGFVTRAVKAADSRAVELALTEQGAVAVQEGVKIVYELRERLIRPLGGNHGAHRRTRRDAPPTPRRARRGPLGW